MGAGTIESSDPVRRRQAARDLTGRLRDFGRRRRAVAGMRGAFWMLALLGFGLLVVAWVDLLVDLPPLVRVAGAAAALLVGVGALAATVLAVRRAARPMQVARDVDRLAGSAGQVAAGLDLTQMPPQARPLTKALAGMAVGRAAELVRGFPEDAVGPLRSVRGAAAGTVAAVCVLVAFAALWPSAFNTESGRLADPWGDHPAYSRYAFTVRPGDAQVLYGAGLAVETDVKGPPLERLNLVVRQPSGSEEALPMFSERSGSWRVHLTDIGEPLTYWVSAGRARSPRYHVSVKYTPQIEQLVVRTEPPAYTNLPAVEGAMPDGGISGLPGTHVKLTARSNRPLSSGQARLDLADGTQRTISADPHPDDARSASLDFTVEQAGQLSLWVVDQAGERSDTEIKAPILLLKDERPFVRIIEPKPESFATPDVPLPVVLDAEDDYGISTLSVYRALNGSRHLPEKLMVPLPAGRKLDRTTYLTLADYGLEPGDLITLFGRAEDTDPAGAKGAESAVVRVSIISRELYEELTRAQQTAEEFQKKYDEAARRLEALRAAADELSKQCEGEKGDKVSEQTQQKLDEFAQQLQKAAEATQQAADQEPLYALDKDLAEPLRQLAEAMAAAGQEASKAAQAARAGSRGQMVESLELARAMLGKEQADYAQAVQQPLERFMAAYALLEMQERFVALADEQRDLAERAAELKGRDGTDDPTLRARMRDLRDEERANQEELDTILQEIRNRAAALPDDPDLAKLKETAVQFVDAVEASRAKPALAETGDALDAFRGTEATERATEAADILESFIKKCFPGPDGTPMGECKLAFGPQRSPAAGTTAQQLLAASGLGTRPGEQGIGSGSGGYSMRTSTLKNVGVYGPARRGGAGSRENAREVAGGATGEPVGGSNVGGMTMEPGASGGSEALPLQALPPRHREGVRAYFRSVAEETSAGKVAEPPAPRDNRQQQPERGTR